MTQPRFMTLKNWAAALVIDFPDDDIPLLYNEKDWKNWGNQLVQCNTFAQNGCPGPGFYKDWQSWATHVFQVMHSVSVEFIRQCPV